MTHTPGPWHATLDEPLITVETGERGDAEICVVEPRATAGGFTDEEKANARLIAAAPDLLAACRAAGDAIFDTRLGKDELALLTQLGAAIAKAEGREP